MLVNTLPFTTGILVGIGETFAERVDALLAIAASHERHGHVQEVIVQNFLAKPGTAMHDHPSGDPDYYLRTVAVARLVLPLGTTAVVADPHEIANVLGTDGVHWLLDAAAGLPLDVYFMASSSIPASRFESPRQ